jgi:glycosyltransferase involved in cell wall biosynthesis
LTGNHSAAIVTRQRRVTKTGRSLGSLVCNATPLCYNPAVMNGANGTVGFDGYYFDYSTTGSGQYASQLWRALSRDVEATPPVRLLRPGSPDDNSVVDPGAITVRYPPLARSGKPAKLWWEQRGLVRAAKDAGVSIIHTPYFSAPVAGRVRTIVTIHDVIPYVMPAYRSSLAMRLYLRLVSRAARNAAAIIADSECSKRDIVRYLELERDRVRVVPLAVDERFRPLRDPDIDQQIRERFALPGQVIFNVGGLDVRKNVETLIRAFGILAPDLDDDTRLVIAGHAHTGNRRLYPPLEPLIHELGLSGKVILTGRISEDDKVLLYNVADVYAFSSIYEGFGLSPLEAMACGTPVVCSNRSSIPEVVGDAGILVEPLPEKFAGAIWTLLEDSQLRRRLSHRSIQRASRFSWERTAAQTRNVYRQVIEMQ